MVSVMGHSLCVVANDVQVCMPHVHQVVFAALGMTFYFCWTSRQAVMHVTLSTKL